MIKYKKQIYLCILAIMLLMLVLMVLELFWPNILPNDFINFNHLRDYIFIVSYVVTTVIALIKFIEELGLYIIEFEVCHKSIINIDAQSKETIFHFPFSFSNSGKTTGIVSRIEMCLTNLNTNAKVDFSWDSFCKDDYRNGWEPRCTIRPIPILPNNQYTDIITFMSLRSQNIQYEYGYRYKIEFSVSLVNNKDKLKSTYYWIPNDVLMKNIKNQLTYTNGNKNFNIELVNKYE